ETEDLPSFSSCRSLLGFMLSPQWTGASIVWMHQCVSLVELREAHESLRRGGIQHQVGVHSPNLEAVGDRAMMTEVLVHARQLCVGLAMFDQVHVEHPAALAAAERGVQN